MDSAAGERPPKRARRSNRYFDGSSYRDAIPLITEPDNNEYTIIHSSEGRLRRMGNDWRTAPMEREPHLAAGTWQDVDSWITPDDAEYALEEDGDWYDEVVEQDITTEDPVPQVDTTKKVPKSVLARRPHVNWKDRYRQVYLDEMLRWEGRGDFRTSEKCPDCTARRISEPGLPVFRCDECFIPDLICAKCCVKRHRSLPFHRIKKWTGSSFVKTTLKDIGLKVTLNHSSMYCENPIRAHKSLLVLHTNGVHEVDLHYCGCSRAIPIHLQLLRRRLYPATQLNVKTCATFELLEHLHMFALTAKSSTYDFYRALEKMTDSTGIHTPRTRYRALFRIVLQWRHLKMLKRAGRAHDPGGVEATQPGELALRCPSCPYPGINIPVGWENTPDEYKFLYMVIICMDANFRLKNQLVSNYSQDPGLGTGWAYLLSRQPYESYVLEHANQQDISTCVGFQALAKSNTKFSFGLRYTGLNLTVCGRSEMIFPLGVGNLHKGERYSNMDYVFGSALQFVSVLLVLISYDICCQWYINLFKRIENDWPDEIKPRPEMKLMPAIPKLHEPAHQQKNHQMYSLNYIPGVGQSDCECPERVWAPHNCLASATKTQGPGSRHDVLDNHFNFWNWEKYINIGATLVRRYRAAVANRNLQEEGHRGLTTSAGEEHSAEWEKICVAWEKDRFPKKVKNPYYAEGTCMSEEQAKLELEVEESARASAGVAAVHSTSPSQFISLGLDLEDAQRRLRRTVKSAGSSWTLHKEGSIKEQRNSLLKRIETWETLLPLYIPGLMQYRADHPPRQKSDSVTNAEDITLWLPSQIPSTHRSSICIAGLDQVEDKLRTAQCSDALDSIRKILTVKSRLVEFKNKNLRGQRDGTRSTTVIDRVHERARLAAEKYRAAREAKLSLVGPGDWESKFKILNDGDIRAYQDAHRLRPRQGRKGTLEDNQLDHIVDPEPPELVLYGEIRDIRQGTGETRRTLSWIWTSGTYIVGSDSDDNVLRVEWAKSRARAARAKEEVMLLKEEIRRVFAFLEWKSKWWKERATLRSDVSKDMAEGLNAYAVKQSELQMALATHFRMLWESPLDPPSRKRKTKSATPQGNAVQESNTGGIDDDDDDDDEELEEDEVGQPDADDVEEYDIDNNV